MGKRRSGIGHYLIWGFLVTAAVLFSFSVSVGDNPGDSDRIAARTSKAVNSRMKVLEGWIGKALSADKEVWLSDFNLPEDMVVYRYLDDTLQFWSNQFPIQNDDISSKVIFQRMSKPLSGLASPLAEVTEDPSFVNYGRNWYLVVSRTLGSRKVIAGLKLVDSADESSPNGVNRKLDLSGNFYIAPLSESGGSVVELSGRPVFKIMLDTGSRRSIVAHSTLIWLALLCLIIASLLHLGSDRSLKQLAVVLFGLFLILGAAFLWGKNLKDNSALFSANVYADGRFFNSLGAVMIVSVFLFLAVCCLFMTRRAIYRLVLGFRKRKAALLVGALVFLFLILAVGTYTHLIVRSIIFNSSITLELYKLNELNVYSLVVHLVLLALLLTMPLLFHILLILCGKLRGFDYDIFTTSSRITFALLASAYLVATTAVLGFRKEQDRVEVWANRLSIDRDISLELELRLQEDKIAADQLVSALSHISNSNYLILNRLVENYLYRASQNYDVVVELFPENISDPRATIYFREMLSDGIPIAENSKFLYKSDSNGHNLYVGSFAYYDPSSGVTMMLLTVSPKSNRVDKGYARILGYSAPGDVQVPSRYSYAKYKAQSLSVYKGSYAYPTILDRGFRTGLLDTPNGFARIGDHLHFVNGSEDDLIVISRRRTEKSYYFVATLFLTLSFYFLVSAISLGRRKKRKRGEKNYYKSRINAAIMFALIMTLITLTAVSVLFVYRRNNENQMSAMTGKVNSLQTLLQTRCRFAEDFTALSTQEMAGAVEDVSNTMKSDITLYTIGGREFRSTTPEIFDMLVLGPRIDKDAFENIIHRNRRYFINKERIGSRKIYFLYAPLFNAHGKMLAIMGSPFTDESFDFKSDAVFHSITVITVFMVLLLIARFLTATAVDKMFKPLSEMGRKMNEAKINNLEYIIYERDDEVSTLVRAYNLMVHDLYDSSKQLTLAERDKAWATMARQVAHEIKNPLTPIKLQIQRLIRMKSNGNPVWADKFDEVSTEVLKQIDLLADTANEFSSFAKLYTEEPVEIDLDKLLKEEIDLFDSKDNITFSYMGLDKAAVTGPKPQLTRVIVNLIGNAVQAIENAQAEEREGGGTPKMGQILVSLRLSSKDGFYDMVFEDNGPGVKEENRSKLFTPNFTTKSNGTGLGLSICRSIIEKCEGDILYSKSFSLKGACFTVRLPVKRK